jgi:threonine aldolase
MRFASDNTSGAAPEILEAVVRANAGYATSYGEDAAMARVTDRVRAIFEAPEAAVYLVATGTAANALGLACLCPPWARVYCHRRSHIEEDECGAVGFYAGGATLTPLDGADGKIDPDGLARALAAGAAASVHNVQPGALSLTNTTEAGTVYTPAEVAALAGQVRARGLPVHMDGARFANAVARLGCAPAELTWQAGVDVLSLGGTKNGCLGVEAVVLFDPRRAREFELRRKRAGHLFSKHRFLSAQIEAYLDDGLWLRLATRANARAAEAAAGLAAVPGVRISHPVEANMLFASWPAAVDRALQAAGAAYYSWPDPQAAATPDNERVAVRLVCSWSTEAPDVDRMIAIAAGSSVNPAPAPSP